MNGMPEEILYGMPEEILSVAFSFIFPFSRVIFMLGTLNISTLGALQSKRS